MGSHRFWGIICAGLFSLSLAACGSGGGFNSDDDDGGGGVTGPVPATLTLLASAPQLSSSADSASEGVVLTAIIRDAGNTLIPNSQVSFSTSDSGALEPTTFDANGRAQTTLTTGGDAQNRSVRVQATAGSLTQSAVIAVVGTTLNVTGPEATQINVPTEFTVTLTDSAGGGIANQAVSLQTNAGNTLSANSLPTDSTGTVSFTLTATEATSFVRASALGLTSEKAVRVSTDEFSFITPTSSGTDPVPVNIGQTQTVRVQWRRNNAPVPDGTQITFSATRGVFDNGETSITVPVSGGSGQASAQISSAVAGPSTVVASSGAFSTETSARIALVFVATTPNKIDVQAQPRVIATNESSQITAIVRDKNNNLVRGKTVEFSLVDPTNGSLSAPTAVTNDQGLARIAYSATSQSSASNGVQVTGRVRNFPSIEDTALITVGGSAVNIVIGTGAEIIDLDESAYQMPFTVEVTDSAGNPVSDADFTLSVQPLAYRKGTFDNFTATCPNEDVDLDDIYTVEKDTNNNGVLDPGRVASIPRTVTLNPATGTGQARLTYPKDHGWFVFVRIIGVVSASGTETTETRDVLLTVAEDDVDNLPGISPYGVDGDGDNTPFDGTTDRGCGTPN